MDGFKQYAELIASKLTDEQLVEFFELLDSDPTYEFQAALGERIRERLPNYFEAGAAKGVVPEHRCFDPPKITPFQSLLLRRLLEGMSPYIRRRSSHVSHSLNLMQEAGLIFREGGGDRQLTFLGRAAVGEHARRGLSLNNVEKLSRIEKQPSFDLNERGQFALLLRDGLAHIVDRSDPADTGGVRPTQLGILVLRRIRGEL